MGLLFIPMFVRPRASDSLKKPFAAVSTDSSSSVPFLINEFLFVSPLEKKAHSPFQFLPFGRRVVTPRHSVSFYVLLLSPFSQYIIRGGLLVLCTGLGL